MIAFRRVFLISAAAATSAFAAEPIWWGVGDAKHQCSVRDDSGAPKGKLLSDNLHWHGPAVFTGCTYEYECDLYWKDEIRPMLNRFLRGKNDPPPEPVFGRLLLNSRVGGKESCVAGVMGKPIKAVFDFKRPCSFTEVDFMCDMARSKPYKGTVSFSDDKSAWSEPVAFEGAEGVCRVRFDEPKSGRYMRFSFGASDAGRERQYLDEVVVWGDGEVSEKYPEAGGACDAPFTAPQSLRGIPETAMDGKTFADWQKRVGADVVVVPTRLHDPQRYSPITNAPPEKFRISMTKSEREMRYFAVANAGNGRTTVKIEKPDFGPGVDVEIWLGAVIHAQHPTRKLTEAQKRDLLLLDLEPPSDIGPLNRMALEPFVRGDMKPQPNFIRRFCGNAEQLLGFPGAFPLEKGEAAVFMLRLTTKDAKPGVRRARLSAGRGRALGLELAVADAELDRSELITLMYGPFVGQFPYETESRRNLDVRFVNDLHVNFSGGAASFPEEGSKLWTWYKSAPDKILRRKLLPGGGAYGSCYFPVSKGKKGKRVTDEDLEAIVAHVGKVKAEAERRGIPKDRYVLDFPDEPRPNVLANLLKIARAVKAAHPDVQLFCNPLFFNGAVKTNETLMADLRSTYNRCIDFSVPGFLAARRDWARNEFFTSAHRANMFYAQPARRMGRHGAWDAAVWGFNGLGYYCYWEYAIRCHTWDLRTNGASILGATYRMAYPSGDGFAITPIYEMMREAVEDFHLVKTLQRRGCGALVDELYKTMSTLRLEADFDAIHERLMAELLK